MTCPEYVRLRQIYEAALRHWGQFMWSSKVAAPGVPERRDAETKQRAFFARNEASERLSAHQRSCPVCRSSLRLVDYRRDLTARPFQSRSPDESLAVFLVSLSRGQLGLRARGCSGRAYTRRHGSSGLPRDPEIASDAIQLVVAAWYEIRGEHLAFVNEENRLACSLRRWSRAGSCCRANRRADVHIQHQVVKPKHRTTLGPLEEFTFECFMRPQRRVLRDLPTMPEREP
jgi:hypothetical protein